MGIWLGFLPKRLTGWFEPLFILCLISAESDMRTAGARSFPEGVYAIVNCILDQGFTTSAGVTFASILGKSWG